MKLRTVNEYHSDMRAKGANMSFMAFIDEDTHEILESGFVVSGYRGEDSHKYFKTEETAQSFIRNKV